MKKIYLSLLSVLGALGLNAQLTQANHAPANGDTYQMYRCDSSAAITPGPSGASAMWNYSTITTYSNLVRSYTAQTNGNTSYPQSNIVLASAANDVFYFSSTTNTLGYYGGNVSAGSVAGTLTYSAPAICAAYPMSFGTSSTAATGGSINVTSPFSVPGTFSGNSSVMVDGSGTISLPGGIVYTNVLRVVTSQTIAVTAAISGTIFETVYDYFASGIKAPVFSISTMTANIGSTTTSTFVTRNKNLTPPSTVGIHENSTESLYFNVFPNPSNTSVSFATNNQDAKFLFVFDITGRLLEKQALNDGRVKLDVSSYSNGLYLYTISSGDKALKSSKFTVSH